jgi:two-component system nitrogen regulation sensor histidine kinase NtrY
MTIKRKFLILFAGYSVLVICIPACIGSYFLHESFSVFAHAKNVGFAQIMINAMYGKALASFLLLVIVFAIISIPVGIMLSRQVSSPYLAIFRNLTDIATKRLSLENSSGLKNAEYELLTRYITLLVSDLAKIKEYEKEKSWKSGARMLMHEIKNPLTPLKLSAQSLACAGPSLPANPADVSRILSSIADMEKIFGYFKELVNIEFGACSVFDIKDHIDSFCGSLAPPVRLMRDYLAQALPFPVFSEATLVKMLFTNLILNGRAENPEEFFVKVEESPLLVTARFVTPHRIIPDPSKLFTLGYSTKENNRGFGLFLCKKISDYLDLNIEFIQTAGDVLFQIHFKRHTL